jgi:hypothetical protein
MLLSFSFFEEARMTCFRNFTVPLWEFFGGNLLMFVAIVFYIAWWTVSFWPNGNGKGTGAGLFIIITLFAGVAAIAIMSIGISSLPQVRKGFLAAYILPGAAAFFIILLAVTKIGFHRAVTSELLLITVWAAVEWSAIAVLHGNDRFSLGKALALAALVALATAVGIICYILHYRLDETSQFWNGLIPLIADAGVVAVLLAVLALSGDGAT